MEIAEKYFKMFGINQKKMAASIQSLECCKEIIEAKKVNTILDAGSGLSSAIFHSAYENVVTIDDDSFWASKTKAFILVELQKNIDISTISSFSNQKFDFVFYDYGSMETRIYYFKQALAMCNRFFYIDDMHVTYYREYIQTKYSQYRLVFLPETIDEYGRYGALICL